MDPCMPVTLRVSMLMIRFYHVYHFQMWSHRGALGYSPGIPKSTRINQPQNTTGAHIAHLRSASRSLLKEYKLKLIGVEL